MSRIYLRRRSRDFRLEYKYFIKIDRILQNQTIDFNETIAIDLPAGGHILEVYQKFNPASRFYFYVEENEEVYFEVGYNQEFMSWIMKMILISLLPSFIALVTHPAVMLLSVVLFLITIMYLIIYGYAMRKIFTIEEKGRREIQL